MLSRSYGPADDGQDQDDSSEPEDSILYHGNQLFLPAAVVHVVYVLARCVFKFGTLACWEESTLLWKGTVSFLDKLLNYVDKIHQQAPSSCLLQLDTAFGTWHRHYIVWYV